MWPPPSFNRTLTKTSIISLSRKGHFGHTLPNEAFFSPYLVFPNLHGNFFRNAHFFSLPSPLPFLPFFLPFFLFFKFLFLSFHFLSSKRHFPYPRGHFSRHTLALRGTSSPAHCPKGHFFATHLPLGELRRHTVAIRGTSSQHTCPKGQFFATYLPLGALLRHPIAIRSTHTCP